MAKNEKAIVQVIAKENDTTAVMKEVHKASDIEENDIISGLNLKSKETRIRDKYCKIKVTYSGTKLAVITALNTLFTESFA